MRVLPNAVSEYWQRAQLHGQSHRRAKPRENAELFWLHGVVVWHLGALVYHTHADFLYIISAFTINQAACKRLQAALKA